MAVTKDLTKIQIILLSCLVSLVTAIITAFITVSLLSEGSAGLNQTVAEVGKHVLDKVAPLPNSSSLPPQQ